MTHRIIDIPGNTTTFEDGPIVQILGPSDAPVNIIIKYHASEIHAIGGPKYGEIRFKSVLEYRWVAHFVEYLPADTSDYARALIQILDSGLIEEMASQGAWRKYPGKRFGDVIKESDVKHFRIVFPEYGRFDVIALGVETRELHSWPEN